MNTYYSTFPGKNSSMRASCLDNEWLDDIHIEDLSHAEKWEQEIEFAPQHIGDNQKVEFVLYKDDKPYLNDPPHLWIDVKGK